MPPHHHSGSHSISHHRGRSGRDSHFYLYESPEVVCYCDGAPCLCPADTGALDAAGNQKPNTLEKRSPLPAGHYWVDVFGLNIPKAGAWFKAMAPLGVHVDSTEHFPSTEVPEVRDWYLFTYTPTLGVPVVWDTSLGFPTVAAQSVKSSQDTVSGADLELNPLDKLSNWVNETEQKFGQIAPYAILGGAALGGFLLLKEFGLLGRVKNGIRKRNSKRA